MMKDIFSYLFWIVVLVISIYATFTGDTIANVFGYGIGSAWYTHIIYIIAHGNILHFLLNFVFLCQLDDVFDLICERFELKRYIILAMCIAVSVLATFVNVFALPTIGLSGYICAKSGFVVGFLNKDYKIKNIIYIVAYNIVFFLFGGVNYLLHIVCFFTMLIVSTTIYEVIKRGNNKNQHRED